MVRNVPGLDPLPRGLPEQVLAKLARADAHVVQAVEAVIAWRRVNQESVIEQPNSDGTEKRFYLTKYEPFPPRLALVIGDALFGLRCSLDHIIYEFYRRKFGQQLTVQQQRKSMFPILHRPEQWISNGKGRIEDLDPEIGALVESLQPYRQATIASRNPATPRDRLNVQLETDWDKGVQRWLGVLDILHNVDKHRSLHVLGRSILVAPHPDHPPPPGVQIISGDGGLHDGAYLGKVLIDPRAPKMQVGMARRFVIELVHDADEYDIPVDLMNISNATKAALSRFVSLL